MGKIINFSTGRSVYTCGAIEPQYQELINRLEKHPASDYSVGRAEILADEVLELGGYSAIECAIPVLRIAEGFGFTFFSAKGMGKAVSKTLCKRPIRFR